MNAPDYTTPEQVARWEQIRALLTPAESALLYNACAEKAEADRKAARDIAGDFENTAAEEHMIKLLGDQAELADKLGELVL